jgi:hypothetical protein
LAITGGTGYMQNMMLSSSFFFGFSDEANGETEGGEVRDN